METDPVIIAAREKLKARFADVRTGGKGTTRRKKHTIHKSGGTDDKKLQGTFKRLGAHPIAAIDEVNLFLADGNVIHFVQPTMQASIPANFYVITGHCETKRLQDLLPGIASQLGADNLMELKKIAEQAYAAKGGAESSNDDVPDLVGENFEDVSNKKK